MTSVSTIFLGIILLVFYCKNSIADEKKVVCYHGTWSVYRHSMGKFEVSDINPFLCTHLIYTFFGTEENGGIKVLDPYLDLEENWGRGNIKKFNDLKNINQKLKTLAAVGGWNEGSLRFSNIAKDQVKRRRFIETSVQFILKHKFDGLDLDWEYPARNGGDPNVDKDNYVIFVKELKTELSKYNLLLTAAVSSVESASKQSYYISKISKYFDFINVMSYDLHGSWDKKIGINAPLYAGLADITEDEKQLNVDASIKYWLNEGAPSEKLILGVPTYGRTFTLLDPLQNEVGSLSSGPGLPGPYTQESGMIGYNELCNQFRNDNSWKIKWEIDQKVPYAFKHNQWIGYDNAKSIALKTKYAINKNLGGIMIWAIETDDFKGVCHEENYYLLKTINRELGRNITDVPSATTPTTSQPEPTSTTTEVTLTTDVATSTPGASSTTESETTTSNSQNSTDSSTTVTTPVPTFSTPSIPTTTTKPPNNNNNNNCKKNGIFRNTEDCSRFFVCSSGIRSDFKCPANLLFDEKIKSCNYPHLVDC